jgi:hypothetical protein
VLENTGCSFRYNRRNQGNLVVHAISAEVPKRAIIVPQLIGHQKLIRAEHPNQCSAYKWR